MFSRYRYGFWPVTVVAFLFANCVFETHCEKSLFDDLPLNGALIPSLPSYSTSPSNQIAVKTSPPILYKPSRSDYKKGETVTKSSLFDDLPYQGALSSTGGKIRNPRDSVDFDITRVAPSNEFEIPSWDSRLLPPIVNFLSRPAGPPQPSRVQTSRGPSYPPQRFRNVYGPPPLRTHSYSYNNNHQPSRQLPERQDIPNGQNKSVNHVSANSGGPTVIVYAHPNKDSQHGNSDQPSSLPSKTDRTETKNEVHYHYHLNENNKDVEKPTSGGYTSGGYVPGGYRPSPPRYGRPNVSQKERPNKPKPSQAYGPPPSRGGPYAESRYNLRPKEAINSYSNTNSLNEDNLEEDDDFSRRTFVPPGRPSGGYRPADTVSLIKPPRPSTSYEVPPSFDAPSSSYHAPSNEYGAPVTPETSYLPPNSPPAPPPVSSDQPGGDQYETTITLQTIPITRQVTELVQVPNVVHKISSNRPAALDQALQDQSFVNPPSSSYGPPAPPPRKNIPQSPMGSFSRGTDRPFDSHLAQILGVGPTQNSKDAVLQELLLGQARQPGSDLTISDLELISLLQGSRGQTNPILTPGRNNFGGLFGDSSRFTGSNSLNSNLFQSKDQGMNSDGLGSLREAFREQRFQLALADLRKQLREQNKDNVRERTSYRSLFTKGALLLSALTLLPSFVNPMASAAGVTSAATTIPNFMLPVTAAGRRKRSLTEVEKIFPSKTAFEKCLEAASEDKSIRSNSDETWSHCTKSLATSFSSSATDSKISTQKDSSTLGSELQYVIRKAGYSKKHTSKRIVGSLL